MSKIDEALTTLGTMGLKPNEWAQLAQKILAYAELKVQSSGQLSKVITEFQAELNRIAKEYSDHLNERGQEIERPNAETWTRERVEAEITKCNEFWEDKLKRQNETFQRNAELFQQEAQSAFETRAGELRDEFATQYGLAEELTRLEVNMLLTTARVDALAAIVEGQPLIEGLRELLPILKEQYDELNERIAEIGMAKLDSPRSVNQAALRIYAIEQATDPQHPVYDGGEGIHQLTQQNNPIFAGVYQSMKQKQQHAIEEVILAARAELETMTEAAAKIARQEALIKALTPKQRHIGLMKWGIQQVMDETEKTPTPAAELLLDRMKPAFEGNRLSDELKRIYQDLKTKYETPGGANRKLIKDVMDYDVIEVPWEIGTTRL